MFVLIQIYVILVNAYQTDVGILLVDTYMSYSLKIWYNLKSFVQVHFYIKNVH